MGLTFDQQVQLWNAIGTWFAGVAGFGAIVTSLYLATRVSKVRLRMHAAVWTAIANGEVGEDLVTISVTNIGERPVVIEQVGWQVGFWRWKRFAMQNFSPVYSPGLPVQFTHGQSLNFRVSLADAPEWAPEFMRKFVRETPLRTLRAYVSTSVGTTVTVVPADSVIKLLKAQRPQL